MVVFWVMTLVRFQLVTSVCRILVVAILQLKMKLKTSCFHKTLVTSRDCMMSLIRIEQGEFVHLFFPFEEICVCQQFLCLISYYAYSFYSKPMLTKCLTFNKSCFCSFSKVNFQFETPGVRLNVFCLFFHLMVVVATLTLCRP
jgi:hypothetical protein